MGESVVSATGYTQKIKDAPASISVVPKEEILTRPIRDLGDAVQDVPGVYVEQDKTGQNTISMRGLSSSYTLILIDGKRQNTNGSFTQNGLGNATSFIPPINMIERIEVIRGPASVIYGSDAMGGVINIITKKHSDKLSGGIQLETKLFEREEFGNAYGMNAYMNTPLQKDILSLNVRVSGRFNEQNGFKKPSWVTAGMTSTDPRGPNPYVGHSSTGSHNWNAGFRFNYTPDTQNYIYLDSEVYNGRFGSLNTSGNSFTSIQEMYKSNTILSHDGTYNWGKLSSYAQYSYTIIAPHASNNPYPNGSGAGLAPGSSKGDYINRANKRTNHNVILQSTYNNDFDFNNYGALILNSGIYYMWEQLNRANVTINGQSTKYNRESNLVAIFAEGEYLINDYISTTLGLRYNYTDLFNINTLNPRFYVNIYPTQWLTLKAGITSGMLIPRLDYLYEGYLTTDRSTTYEYGNKNLKPEQSWNYELSAIVDTKPAMFILTGYYTDYNNKITTTPYYGGLCAGGQNTCTIYQNVNNALIAGLEASFTLKPIYGFSLDASYGFTYTKRLSDEYITNINQVRVNVKGQELNEIPMHSFTITPKYRYEDFNAYVRWNGRFKTPTNPTAVAARSNARYYVGRYYKDYQVVDIAASYTFLKNYTMTLAINNIFDVYFMDYTRTSSTQQGQTIINAQNLYQRVLPSRNYWLTFRADF